MLSQFIIILISASITYGLLQLRRYRKAKRLEIMSDEDLSDAVLHHEISLFEIPSARREEIERILARVSASWSLEPFWGHSGNK